MNETIRNLTQRRSVRKYKSEQITDEQLGAILLAGEYAPTGKGNQSPLMVVVQNPETIKQLSALNGGILGIVSDPFYGAPTVIVVFADSDYFTHLEDGSLVMGNLLNAAYSVGVDSCWIHRAKEVFESEAGRELKKKWGVPENYVGIGNCILGYRDCELPAPKPRKANYIIFEDGRELNSL